MPCQHAVSWGFGKSRPPWSSLPCALSGRLLPRKCINSATAAPEMLVWSEGGGAAMTDPVLMLALLLGVGWDAMVLHCFSSRAGAGTSSPLAHCFMHGAGPYPHALACSIPVLPQGLQGCQLGCSSAAARCSRGHCEMILHGGDVCGLQRLLYE